MRQIINNTPANSGLGDTLFESMNKINAMTLELYAADSSFTDEIDSINLTLATINDGTSVLNHRHTIAQIQGLQSALNLKVSTSIYISDMLAINASIQAINDTLSDIIVILNTKIEEAPFSGITYGRNNGAWVEISGATGDFVPYTGATKNVDLNTYSINADGGFSSNWSPGFFNGGTLYGGTNSRQFNFFDLSDGSEFDDGLRVNIVANVEEGIYYEYSNTNTQKSGGVGITTENLTLYSVNSGITNYVTISPESLSLTKKIISDEGVYANKYWMYDEPNDNYGSIHYTDGNFHIEDADEHKLLVIEDGFMQLHLSDTIQSNLFTTLLTATRDHYLPNNSGTIALTTDITTFTGGTVSGATRFTNGLTANTISATTVSATTYNGYEPADMRTDLTNRRLGYTVSTDFLSTFTAALAPFSFSSSASGTLQIIGSQIDNHHPGVQQIAAASGLTNSGGNINSHAATNAFSVVFTDGLQTDLIFKLPTTTTNNVIRIGFTYGNLTITPPTSGNYFEITGTTLVGITRNNNVQSQTSSFTLTASTWYHSRVKETIVGTANTVTFTVYDMSGVTLYNQSLTTNINTATTRGVNVICLNTVSNAAITSILYLDYLGVTFPPMIRGALD